MVLTVRLAREPNRDTIWKPTRTAVRARTMAAPERVAIVVRTELERDKAGAVASFDGDSQIATATVQITQEPTATPHQPTTDLAIDDRGRAPSRMSDTSVSGVLMLVAATAMGANVLGRADRLPSKLWP
ncbi:MAG: hypothetical protein ACP5VR_08515 [Acidimicrobiales bacterium]